MKKYQIELTQAQRQELNQIIKAGQARARKILHAHILLKSDSGEQGPAWSYTEIEHAFGVGESTIVRVRKRFVEHGLADALDRRPQPPRPEKRILNGRHEAYLIALSAAKSLRDESAGACDCWPTRWSKRAMWSRWGESRLA